MNPSELNALTKTNVKPLSQPGPTEGRKRLATWGEINPKQADAVLAELSDAQRAKVEATAKRARKRASAPPMKLEMNDNGLSITYPGKSEAAMGLLLMAELGTCDPSFYAGIIRQVATMGAHGAKLDESNSNFVVSVVRAVEPRDELETMLAVQMGAVHTATMMMARRLNHVSNLPQQDAAERALNKLARTFATQMETLKRYRTGGQQKVIVEHVTVNEGGQAIVGNVTHGGRGKECKTPTTPTAQCSAFAMQRVAKQKRNELGKDAAVQPLMAGLSAGCMAHEAERRKAQPTATGSMASEVVRWRKSGASGWN